MICILHVLQSYFSAGGRRINKTQPSAVYVKTTIRIFPCCGLMGRAGGQESGCAKYRQGSATLSRYITITG